MLRLVGGGLAAGLQACAPREAAAALPNIVFILADDLGWHQLSCYGNSFYETPNIDRLAREGMRFTQAYAAAPVCSPTRASLMTGKYPARLHITDFIPGNPYPFAKLKTPDWQRALPLREVTIAEWLRERGYATGHFGKWHLNKDKEYRPGRPGDPGSQGFDTVLTTRKPDPGDDPCADAHHVRLITRHAIDFIEWNQNKPFFCYVTHNTIHRPQLECPDLVAKYRGKPEADPLRGNNPVAGAMVETLDKSVGRILAKLDELGLTDDTLVVFFSDNGPLYGFDARKPLYGGKGDLYEGGIRVPLLMRWPAGIDAGSECHVPVISNDFFPTFADILGQSDAVPPVDGVSLAPLFNGAETLGRDALYWHYPHYHRLTSDDGVVDHPVKPHGAVRAGRYKLIEWFEKSIEGLETPGALELYDLEADPGESNDLAVSMPDKTRELYRMLRQWRMSVGAQEMTPNPNYDPARAHIKKLET